MIETLLELLKKIYHPMKMKMNLYHPIQVYQVVIQVLQVIQVNKVKKSQNLDHALEKLKINDFFNYKLTNKNQY